MDGVEGRAGRIADAGSPHDPPTGRIFNIIFFVKNCKKVII